MLKVNILYVNFIITSNEEIDKHFNTASYVFDVNTNLKTWFKEKFNK